ncbi:hypothetical protein V6N12_053598 [Hibiscus sabdariffa]|uniref:Uncharacterized protein n=1 Tax=Hibiscus sabdariffa TaxID=183260 RepID=A0ABR2D818_9ROSI
MSSVKRSGYRPLSSSFLAFRGLVLERFSLVAECERLRLSPTHSFAQVFASKRSLLRDLDSKLLVVFALCFKPLFDLTSFRTLVW